MTKKDYVKIGNVLKRHNINYKTNQDLIVDLCNAFYMDNYNFDTNRFIDYLESEKVYKER